MANQITNYKCPACTGPLHFEGKSGALECEYCGSSFTPEEIEEMYAGQNEAAAEAEDDFTFEHSEEEWAADGMKAYSCPSCGAELICEEETAATACPYCGNPTIVPGQFKNELRPDYIIPFALDKNNATAKLKEHYGGKFLLPKKFSAENHIKEVKGIYVPFWLYDGVGEGSVIFHATKEQVKETSKEKITITDHYRVERNGSVTFEKIPADASKKMPDDLMDSIEPFNYDGLTKFSESYLPGYLADKYDVTCEENTERALKRAHQSVIEKFTEDARSRNSYDSLDVTTDTLSVKSGKAYYSLFPVWLLSTKWNGENYMFAMNGQTGKMVGDLPVDKVKATITFIVSMIISAIFCYVVGSMIFGEPESMFGILAAFIVVPAIISGLILFGLYSQLKDVEIATEANAYITQNGINIKVREDKFIRRSERRSSKSDD